MGNELPRPHVLAPTAWLLYLLGGLVPVFVLFVGGGFAFSLTYLIPGALLAVLFSRIRGPNGVLAIVVAVVGIFLAFLALLVVALFIWASTTPNFWPVPFE